MPIAPDIFEQTSKAVVGFDGVYTGRVLETLDRNRKRFLVEGVLKPALPLELNGERRRGYRPGEVIILPGHAVKPTDQKGSDYAGALRRAIAECKTKSQAMAKAYMEALVGLMPDGR